MFILGHAGITLGIAVTLEGAFAKYGRHHRKGRLEPSPRTSPAQNDPPEHIASWFTSLGNRIDIRLLLIGSLLPDIIDKPVGQLLFRDTISSGRIVCHTLLFLIFVTTAGLWLYRSYGKTWLLVLSFGSFTHLVFDQMWLFRQTLLWPLYGFAFEKVDLALWVQNIFHALLTDPAVYIPEIIGAAIVIRFAWVLVRKGESRMFISNGKMRAS